MTLLSELTTTHISEDRACEPGHVVVTLSDDRLFNYPFIFMSDVGTAGFDDDEVVCLRAYLPEGRVSVGRRLLGATGVGAVDRSDRARPEVERIPQIPSIQFWRMTGAQRPSAA